MVPADEIEEPSGARAHKRLLTLVPGLILVGLLAYGLLTSAGRGPAELPDFELPLVGSAGTLTDEEVRSGPAVLNFWASWCGPCKLEAPVLQRAYERYSGRGIGFYGIVVQDSEEGAAGFIEDQGITFPNALDTGEQVSSVLFEFFGLPRTYFIDAEGRLAGNVSGPRVSSSRGIDVLGPISERELTRRIEQLLE